MAKWPSFQNQFFAFGFRIFIKIDKQTIDSNKVKIYFEFLFLVAKAFFHYDFVYTSFMLINIWNSSFFIFLPLEKKKMS